MGCAGTKEEAARTADPSDVSLMTGGSEVRSIPSVWEQAAKVEPSDACPGSEGAHTLQAGQCVHVLAKGWVSLLEETTNGWRAQPEVAEEESFVVRTEDIVDRLPPFPREGVSLSCIQSFRRAHAALIDAGETTTDICERAVKPMTERASTSLAAVLRRIGATDEDGRPFIGVATVFISHAWRYRFCDLLDAVEAFIRSQPSPHETYVWLDLFANDQHNAPSLPQLWWRQTFRCAIETIGHTCVVLSPWEDPIPLKRAWCLWEVLCTINGNVPLTVQLPPKEFASFEEALKTGRVHLVSRAMSNIDVRQSDAYKKADKDMILAAVEATVGFPGVNRLVSLKMRRWIATTGMEIIQRLSRAERASSVLLTKLLKLCNGDLGFDCIDPKATLGVAEDYAHDVAALRGPLDTRALEARHCHLLMLNWTRARDPACNFETHFRDLMPRFVALRDDCRRAHPDGHPATANVLDMLGLGHRIHFDLQGGCKALATAEGREDFELSHRYFREACEIFSAWRAKSLEEVDSVIERSEREDDSEYAGDAVNALGNLIDLLRTGGRGGEAQQAMGRWGHLFERFVSSAGGRHRMSLLFKAKAAQLALDEALKASDDAQRDEAVREIRAAADGLSEVVGHTHYQTTRYQTVLKAVESGTYVLNKDWHQESIDTKTKARELLRRSSVDVTTKASVVSGWAKLVAGGDDGGAMWPAGS